MAMSRIRSKQIVPAENCIPPAPTVAGRVLYAKGSPLVWTESATPSAANQRESWDGTADFAVQDVVASGTALPTATAALVGQRYALQVANASGEQLHVCIPRGAGYAWKQIGNGLWIPDLNSATGFTVTQSSGGTGSTSTTISGGKINFASSTNYAPATNCSVSFSRPAIISNRRRFRYQITVASGASVPNVGTYSLVVSAVNFTTGGGAGYRILIFGDGTLQVQLFRAGGFTAMNLTSGFVPAAWTGGFTVGMIIDPLSATMSIETSGGGAAGAAAGKTQVVQDYTGNESTANSTTASDNNSWWSSAWTSSSLSMSSTAATGSTTAFGVQIQLEELETAA